MEFLFYLLIFIIYLIIQVRAAKRKQQQQQTEASLPTALPGEQHRSQQEVSLEDALLEIRKSLGMETPSTTPPPQPPTPNTVEPPREVEQPREFHARPTTFADADFENKPTAFGKLPSIHKHEQVPARTKVPQRSRIPERAQVPKSTLEKKAGAMAQQDIKGRIDAPEVKALQTTGPSAPDSDNLRDLLQDPKLARKAFVLGEVLGPPRAHRPR